MTMLALTPGSTFAGRYRIERCIAQGGMGAVYEVVHLETERRRALKVMLPDMLQSQEMRDRFRLEARVTANIESEFLVDVFDAGIDEITQMPFLVMELLRGEEVHKRLKRHGRFTFQEVVTYLHQASLALDKTHKASVVHRDLKPGNLFITERDDGSPRVKVLDFGIAKLVAEGATHADATRNLGTPVYMAPEQFHVGARISPASDIYALGMISFTLLTGKPYWYEEMSSGSNVFAFAARAVLGPQESACARALRQAVKLPPAYDDWFKKVTALNPAERFQTASSAIIALGEVLGAPIGQPASRLSLADRDASGPPTSVPTLSGRSDAVGMWPVNTPGAPIVGAPAPAAQTATPAPPPHSNPTPAPYSNPTPAPHSNPAPTPHSNPALTPHSNPALTSHSTPTPFPHLNVTPAPTPSANPTPSALLQSGSLTTGAGLIAGVPAVPKRPSPALIIGGVAAALFALVLIAFFAFSDGAPPPDPQAAASSQAVSGTPALSSEPTPTPTVIATTPSAPVIASAEPKPPAPAASASASAKSTKPKAGGGGPRRPAIYTPD